MTHKYGTVVYIVHTNDKIVIATQDKQKAEKARDEEIKDQEMGGRLIGRAMLTITTVK